MVPQHGPCRLSPPWVLGTGKDALLEAAESLEALGPSLVRLWDFPSQWQLPSCREEGIPVPDASGSRSRKAPNFGLNCCRGAA